eukprot:3210549-Pyramimonas_sp.AAC.1
MGFLWGSFQVPLTFPRQSLKGASHRPWSQDVGEEGVPSNACTGLGGEKCATLAVRPSAPISSRLLPSP